MSILDNLYKNIKHAHIKGTILELPNLEHHTVHYARFLIEDKLNIKLSLQETKQYMYEEGLLPDEEYFSPWYITKYKNTKKTDNGTYLERQSRY